MRGEAERRKGELRGERRNGDARSEDIVIVVGGVLSGGILRRFSARWAGAKKRERVPSTDEDAVDAGCAVEGVEPGAERWVTVDERGVASLADVGARARRFAKKREVVPSTV